MVGTLVICLPSAHQRGEIVLSHNGQKYKFATAECQPSFAAWHANVRHEIKEVTSEYRLVFTYNLVKQLDNSIKDYSATQMAQTYSPIREALETWSATCTFENPRIVNKNELIYMLDHSYLDASLSFVNLKASDRVKVRALARFAKPINYTLFLASMESSIFGSCEEDYPSSERYRSSDEEKSEEEQKDFHFIEETREGIQIKTRG